MYFAPVMWTLGGAVVTFVVAAFIWVALLILLRDNTRKDDKKSMLTLALGSEEICSRVAAACVAPCPRLNNHTSTCPVEEILRYITNGNRIILFIVRKETSGEVEKLIQYVQAQVDLMYANKPIQNRQLYYSLRYAIFGIGDSAEARDDFNRLAMKIDVNLRLLGATRVVPLRLYDSTTSPVSVEEEFNEWFTSLAPEAELSSAPAEAMASGCEQDTPKGILAKKEKKRDLEEEDEEEASYESSADCGIPSKKQKPPVPILRSPSPKQKTSVTPESSVDEVKKSSESPEKETPSDSASTLSSPKESASTSPDTRSSRTPPATPTPKEPVAVPTRAPAAPTSPKLNKARSTDSSPQLIPKNEHKKIKDNPTAKNAAKSKAKGHHNPPSSPKGHSKSKSGGKPHGGGVSIDTDESSLDDDWEIMEIPVDGTS